jgi:hypothetical protein
LQVYDFLDSTINWKNRVFLKRETEWSLNDVNVYNRFNILTITANSNIDELPNGQFRVRPTVTGFGQLPILPTISLRMNLAKKVES